MIAVMKGEYAKSADEMAVIREAIRVLEAAMTPEELHRLRYGVTTGPKRTRRIRMWRIQNKAYTALRRAGHDPVELVFR